jgi:hypothetical protein
VGGLNSNVGVLSLDEEVRSMRKVAPSVLVGEELDRLLADGVEPDGGNIISELCRR